jgi:hypothetical protein
MTTIEEFGMKILGTIERRSNASSANRVVLAEVASIFREALEIPEPANDPVPVFFQPQPKGEFPKWRVKIDGGKEIERRAVYSLYEEQALMVEDPLFSSVDAYSYVPPKEGN